LINSLKIFDALRILSDGQAYPIDRLVSSLKCTLADVLDIMEAMQAEYGLTLFNKPCNTYQLSKSFEWLNEEAVYSQLTPDAHRAFTLTFVDEIDSSNSFLKQLAQKNASHGLVFSAEWQKMGRGRMDRKWHMRLGGSLACSVLWYFEKMPFTPSSITLAAGVAVVRALAKLNVSAQLKWPNDILLAQHKLGGILVEMLSGATHHTAVVIGIGLNIESPTPSVPYATGCIVKSRNTLLASVLNALYVALTTLSTEGFKPFQKEWESFCAHLHIPVSLCNRNGQEVIGVAQGINEEGALQIKTKNGIQTYHVGEITLRALL
jgi:BirA family biotin operon repressor/biotin-[acetyl-CoA-carboxylase] ligase